MRIPALSLVAAACGASLFAQTSDVVKEQKSLLKALQAPPPGAPPAKEPPATKPAAPTLPPPLPPDPPKPQPPGTDFMSGATLTLTGKAPAAGSVEEAIAAALRNHPDVKLAEAQRMVADAMLEQAKLAAMQKVAAAFAKVQAAKLKIEAAERDYNRTARRFESATGSAQERDAAQAALALAKAELDAATADLEAAKGGPARLTGTFTFTKESGGAISLYDTRALALDAAGMPVPSLSPAPATGTTSSTGSTNSSRFETSRPLSWQTSSVRSLPATDTVAKFGPTGEKLRTLIEKKITVDTKASAPAFVFDYLLKASGETGIVVRLPDAAKLENLGPEAPPIVAAMKGEQTFLAWMQLVMDDLAAFTAVPEKVVTSEAVGPGGRNQTSVQYRTRDRYEVYVRDYGLLVTTVKAAPEGAVTLADFAKAVQAQKAAAKIPPPPEAKEPVPGEAVPAPKKK